MHYLSCFGLQRPFWPLAHSERFFLKTPACWIFWPNHPSQPHPPPPSTSQNWPLYREYREYRIQRKGRWLHRLRWRSKEEKRLRHLQCFLGPLLGCQFNPLVSDNFKKLKLIKYIWHFSWKFMKSFYMPSTIPDAKMAKGMLQTSSEGNSQIAKLRFSVDFNTTLKAPTVTSASPWEVILWAEAAASSSTFSLASHSSCMQIRLQISSLFVSFLSKPTDNT